jgi:2-dehydropantoate 2-reductase
VDLRGDRVRIQPVNGSPRGGGSSWQSLTRGTGSIEADYLNGEIVLLGREHGVPTPVNEVLQRLANQAARERQAPGSTGPSEVMALIGA